MTAERSLLKLIKVQTMGPVCPPCSVCIGCHRPVLSEVLSSWRSEKDT